MDPTQDRFERLWKEAERSVKGVVAKNARRATREDREDIVQAVRIKAWKSFSDYDPARSFAGWVCRIAQNASVDWIRAAIRRRELDPLDLADWQADGGPSPHDLAANDEISPRLREAISRLAPRVRETFALCHSGLTYEEVAALMGCPLGTVKARQHRATARLRELLGPDFLANRG